MLTKADYDQLPDPTDRRRARRAFNGRRQAIGPVAGLLLDRFGLAFPRARSHWGAWARLAAKVAAFNLAVYFNYLFRRPPFALFDPLA